MIRLLTTGFACPTSALLVLERITAEERPYFTVEEVTITSTKEAWFVARLDSLTKSANSGYLYLLNARRVFYNYVGDEPETLYRLFSHDGPVRIMCVAHMDGNLEINLLEIHQIEKAIRRPEARGWLWAKSKGDHTGELLAKVSHSDGSPKRKK